MPDIENLTLSSPREIEFIFEDGRKKRRCLWVGMPFEYSEDQVWCCPYEFSTESHKKLCGMFGVDAFYKRWNSMKTLGAEIERRGRTEKVSFTF